jgi:AcrR family transcriptional regulator
MSQSLVAKAAAIDGRSARWDEHRSARHTQILDAALRMIATEGDAVGVAAIAESAGVPRSVVYRLFRDREDLDEQIRQRIIDELLMAVGPSLTPRGTVRDTVAAAVTTYVGWVKANPRLHQFLGMGSASHRSVATRSVTGTKTAVAVSMAGFINEMLATSLAPAKPPRGMAENLAFGLLGFIDVAVNRWVSRPRARSSAGDLTEFLTEGACALIVATAAIGGVELDLDRVIG